MEHARRRCGRSCLGPGFESPRLHEKRADESQPFFSLVPPRALLRRPELKPDLDDIIQGFWF